MKIVDIHAHIYPRINGVIKRKWVNSHHLGLVKIDNEYKQFLPPQFENTNSPIDVYMQYMKWLGISKAILMPNLCYGYYNDYFIEAVNKYPNKLKGVAIVDLLSGKKGVESLNKIYKSKVLFGFKIATNITYQYNKNGRIIDKEAEAIWECISGNKQPVFIHPSRIIDIEDTVILARKYKNINFIICHMGADACFVEGINKGTYEWLLNEVYKFDNIYMDTSTVPYYMKEDYPFESSIKVVEQAYAKLGAEKLMWSSDYPDMCMYATLRQLINWVKLHCKKISVSDREKIMGLNAERLFFKGE